MISLVFSLCYGILWADATMRAHPTYAVEEL